MGHDWLNNSGCGCLDSGVGNDNSVFTVSCYNTIFVNVTDVCQHSVTDTWGKP